MKKNAIIDIIENDLREMLTLLSSFKDSDRIPKDFIDLLEQKHAGIGREVALLNYWASENIVADKDVTLTAEVKPSAQDTPKPEEKPQQPAQRQPRVIKITNVSTPQPTIRRPAQPAPAEEPAAAPTPEPEKPAVQEKPTNAEAPAPAKPQPAKEPKLQQPKPAEQPKSAKATKAHSASASDITTYGTPVDDIKKAIGFNDRFLYLREVFGGNSMAYDAAIETINASADYASAHDYLVREFGLDESQQVVESFLKAVHRRFL